MCKIILLLVYLSSSFCFAQEQSKEIAYDFGKIATTAIVTTDFELNQDIRNVVSTCECVKVSAQPKRKSSPIPSIVHVEFDPSSYEGDVQLEVYAVDKQNTFTRIKLTAHVIKMP